MAAFGCSDNPNHPGHVLVSVPDWWDHEHAKIAKDMMAAALAEVGYKTEPYLDGNNPSFAGQRPPPDVFCKARRLVCDRMGIPYEVVS